MDEQENCTLTISAPPHGEPKLMEQAVLKINDIKIKQLNHGYVVEVGCQIFAIETKEKLINKLTAYLNDPDKVQNKWLNENIL